MLADAHIWSLGYLWEPLLLRREQKKNEGHILVISESIFKPATMNFAVGFDLIKAASQFAGTNVKRIAAFRVDWVYN